MKYKKVYCNNLTEQVESMCCCKLVWIEGEDNEIEDAEKVYIKM